MQTLVCAQKPNFTGETKTILRSLCAVLCVNFKTCVFELPRGWDCDYLFHLLLPVLLVLHLRFYR